MLDAESKGAAFKFYSALAGGLGGKVSLRNLTITRGRSDYFDGAAVAYDGAASGGGFTLERVAVLASETVSYGHSIVYVNQSASGQVKLLDNVFAQNQVKVSSSSIVVVDCAGVALCSVNNNSIHDNYAYDDKHPFALFLLGTVYAANNAVANNLAGTVYGGVQAGTAGTRTLSLRNNHFENDNFSGEYLEQGTTSGSAKWTLVGAYRTPNPNSPLRNSGVNSPLGGVGSKDIAGQARIQDGTIDRGAIEVAPTPNSAPQLNVLPQYTVPASVGVGFDLFIAYAFDDGLPQPLTFSFTYNSCPDLVTIAAATGSVRLKAPVPAGLPSELLQRRPDILRAEQALAAATARIGIAKAARFPRLSITGFLGVASPALSNLLLSGSDFGASGLGLAGPLLNAQSLGFEQRAAEAQARQALAQYEQTILVAFKEVEDALTAAHTANTQRKAQQEQVAALRSALQLTDLRFQNGILVNRKAVYRI